MGFFSNNQADEYEKQFGKLIGQYSNEAALSQSYLKQALGLYDNSLIEGRRAIARSASMSRIQARDAGQQAMATSNRTMDQRGFGNSTLSTNAAAGIQGQTAMNVAGISAQEAGAGAQLGFQHAGAKAGILNALAANKERIATQRAGLQSQQIQSVLGAQANQYAGLGSLLGGIGSIAGTAMGGSFGGALGAKLFGTPGEAE